MNLSFGQNHHLELPGQILAVKATCSGLTLDHCQLGDVKLPPMVAAIKVCRRLATVNLSNNELTDDSMDAICAMVGTLERSLTCLDVGSNDFTELGARVLGETVARGGDGLAIVRVGKAKLPARRLRGLDGDGGGDGGFRVDLSDRLFAAIDGAFAARLTSAPSALATVSLSGHPLPLRRLFSGSGVPGEGVDLRGRGLGPADAWIVAGCIEADLRPGLVELNLDGNAVRASGALALGLALRHSRCLKVLSLNGCQLTDDGRRLDGLAEIGASLAGNPHLERLSARDNDVDEESVIVFAEALEADGLRSLDLRENPFADGPGGARLSRSVSACKRLDSLNGLDVDARPVADFRRHQSDGFQLFEMDFLASRLRLGRTCVCLVLDGNQLGPGHLLRLARALGAVSHVEALSLRDNRLSGLWFDRAGNAKGTYDPSGRDALAEYLRHRAPSLRRLDLRKSGIDDRGEALAEALFEGQSIVEEFNGIDLRVGASDYDAAARDERVKAPVVRLERRSGGLPTLECAFLARGLMDQEELLTLEAPGNGLLDPWSARALGAALSSASTRLRRLVLDGTKLRCDGAVALFVALRSNSHLEVLDLSNADICLFYVGQNKSRSIEPAEACAAMLRRNTTLEHLKLKRNDLRDDGADLIAAALGENATLQSLSLAQNGVRSVPSLPDALRENATLESLDLGDNALTSAGPQHLVAIARALAANTALRRLDITGSGVDDPRRMVPLEPAAVAICRCLKVNARITKIVL